VLNKLPAGPRLSLVTEAKIADLLGDSPTGRYETSGIALRDGVSYVVFDDVPHIGRIASLTPGSEGNGLLNHSGRPGYKDIAYDPAADHFFSLTEASPRGTGFMAKIRELDGEFRHLSTAWLDFPLETENTGMEGLTCVSFGAELYLLALCEGNRCRGAGSGREPGGGRIQISGDDEPGGTMRPPFAFRRACRSRTTEQCRRYRAADRRAVPGISRALARHSADPSVGSRGRGHDLPLPRR
jgi:hypothetical protein